MNIYIYILYLYIFSFFTHTFFRCTDNTTIECLGDMKFEDTIDQLEKWNITLPSTTANYNDTDRSKLVIFFSETKYLDLGAGMVSSGVLLRISPYIFSNANLNFWKFLSHLVCPTAPTKRS